jgi:prophage antirepressor-like protein
MSQPFNPFAIFNYSIPRRFLVRPGKHNYTEEQLNEEVEHNLRTYRINEQIWYLAKDVVSFLGITPDHTSRSIGKINQSYVRHERLMINNLNGNIGGPYVLALVNEAGVYELIKNSRTFQAEKFNTWLYNEVLPCLNRGNAYQSEQGCVSKLMSNIDYQNDANGFIYCIGSPSLRENCYKVGKVRSLKNLNAYKRSYGKIEVKIVKHVNDRHKSEIDLRKLLRDHFVYGELVSCEFGVIENAFGKL